MWLALIAALAVAAFEFRSLRTAGFHEVTVYTTVLCLTIAMGGLISFEWWPRVHLLAPLQYLFTPLTDWLYKIL
jgi:hypothetical protein